MAFTVQRRIATAGMIVALALVLACGSDKSTDIDDDDDIIPAPAAIADLRVVDSTRLTLTLAWTVPHADAGHGAAAWYDLRMSTSAINEATWSSATPIEPMPSAKPGGSTETILVSGLTSGTCYYFGLKCCTSGAMWSPLSNSASASTVVDAVVAFADANLEAAVRDQLEKPAGDILSSEMESLFEIRAEELGITDLAGLEHATKLRFLKLMNNSIDDLTPIAGLTDLYDLQLYGNRISDLSPLAGLSNLGNLNIGANLVTDLSPLANLKRLESLRIHSNRSIAGLAPLSGLSNLVHLDITTTGTSDISALAGMTSLQTVSAGANQIADLSALQGLPALTTLVFPHNQITDLAPLLANAGLGAGDLVEVRFNPLTEQARNVQIPALRAREVTVNF